ncbi:MAG: RidA family protein [Planctomycetes bacterium]|nr:RidA family protein [Planctomycetota bacterium]MCW8134152.1 RidA family protein [Planctomycetota bacterium]
MEISTEHAPAFPTILSQARRAGNLVFTSGTVPMKPGERTVSGTTIEEQTRLSIENLAHVLNAAGAGLPQVIKVTVYLTDMADYRAMNSVYKQHFKPPMPARTCVAVKELALPDMRIELDAVAELPG